MNITWTEYLNVFFFVYLPYLAIGFFIAGLAYRVMNDNRNIQALSTQFLRNDKMLKWGSNLFHYAIIFVLIGHIIGLLTPEPLYDWLISNETKRLLAITMGCASGIVALVGICLLMMRRFTDARVRANSSMGDFFIVVLIFIQIVLGMMSTTVTIFSPLHDYMTIDYWAQGLCIFHPDSWQYLEHTNILHKLHIINGFVILIIFPFSKLMHMVMVPVRYLLTYLRTGANRNQR